MKATLTSVFVVLFAAAVLAQAPQADLAAREAPFYTGVSDTASLRSAVEQRTARADEYPEGAPGGAGSSHDRQHARAVRPDGDGKRRCFQHDTNRGAPSSRRAHANDGGRFGTATGDKGRCACPETRHPFRSSRDRSRQHRSSHEAIRHTRASRPRACGRQQAGRRSSPSDPAANRASDCATGIQPQPAERPASTRGERVRDRRAAPGLHRGS